MKLYLTFVISSSFDYFLQSSGEPKLDLSIIEKGFTDLVIHEGPHYEVVKKAAEKPKQSKFKLNR